MAAEHAEHVRSVKRALESTDKSLEDLQAAAAKEHEGNLLIINFFRWISYSIILILSTFIFQLICNSNYISYIFRKQGFDGTSPVGVTRGRPNRHGH